MFWVGVHGMDIISIINQSIISIDMIYTYQYYFPEWYS